MAIDIFSTHHPTLSQSLTDPLNVAVMLNREGVITGQALTSVVSASPSVPAQRDGLLAAVGEAVRTKYTLLQTFASVLCKFTGNAQLGAAIQRDYGKYMIIVLCCETIIISETHCNDNSSPITLESNEGEDIMN